METETRDHKSCLRQSTIKKEKKKGRKTKKKKKKKSYVGKNVIESRYVGSKNDRKTYDIKCSKCPFVSNRLKQHLVKNHICNVNEAILEESKVRVLFSWAQKDKHGVAKPLPCEECSCWYARLETHLKGKSHNYNDETVITTVRHMRSKYWCDVTGKIKENVSSSTIRLCSREFKSYHCK